MIKTLLLSPPVVFLLLLLLGLALSQLVSSYAATGQDNQRKSEAYASGQRNFKHRFSPDYSQFFPYAFFFTIVHILVLVVATASGISLAFPLLYIAAGLLALYIIVKR